MSDDKEKYETFCMLCGDKRITKSILLQYIKCIYKSTNPHKKISNMIKNNQLIKYVKSYFFWKKVSYAIPEANRTRAKSWEGICPWPPPAKIQKIIIDKVWLPAEKLKDEYVNMKEYWANIMPQSTYETIGKYLGVRPNGKPYTMKDKMEDTNLDKKILDMLQNGEWKKFFLTVANEFDYSPYILSIIEDLRKRNEHFGTSEQLSWDKVLVST